MTGKRDLALEALLSVRKERAAHIPEELIREAYQIQVQHQFDRERDVSLQRIARAVEGYIEASSGIGGRK